MSSSTLLRLAAIAGLLSGLFSILEQVLPAGLAAETAGLLGPLFGLYLIAGLYVEQREASGTYGGIAYIVLSFGLALVVGLAFASAYVLSFLSPSVEQSLMAGPTGAAFMFSSLLTFLGIILFGIAILRARVFPGLAAVLLIVGHAPIAFTPFMPHVLLVIGAVVFAAGLAWLGYALWSIAGNEQETMSPASEPSAIGGAMSHRPSH